MRILIMATSNFALPSLEALLGSNHQILGLITQVDKPSGRGYKLQSPPTKILALKKNIPVWQFESIKSQSAYEFINGLNLDLIVIIAYGQIIPDQILSLPKKGSINLHASLLPKYRGAAPINWALIKGEKVTGNTIAWVTKQLDAGDIILQKEHPISLFDNFGVLHEILAQKGAKLLLKAIQFIQDTKAPRLPQDETQASYAPSFKKESLKINWFQPANDIHNFIRAFSPKSGAFTYLQGKKLKILTTLPSQLSSSLSDNSFFPGTITEITKEGFLVATKFDFILVTLVQLEGGRPLPTSQFLRGHQVSKGTVLGVLD
ncbi:methionyl-tRNA formyltransferase [bacterium]|nr:methionyl-tRNA formyltransferase [bacterium]